VAPAERASVLVIRAWNDRQTGVRARLLAGEEPAGTRSATASGIEDICGVVRKWLEALAELGDTDVTFQ
jgi:hypothetical protein